MKTLAQNSEIKILSVADREYPTNLRYIYDPPAVIYVQGDILPEDNIAVAIVGSRRGTYYGLRNAEKLSFELAAKGVTIISGLARGVDSAAHRGALKAKGRTIAVLGSGLNMLYPPENKGLAQEIARHGAVISEFSPETPPYGYNFPRRNRIISGLALGVVIVEAAKRSGALITANCALEQGREVFALPGNIDSFTSRGTHDLIKQGAKLVESCQDIIEELEPLAAAYTAVPESQAKPRINPAKGEATATPRSFTAELSQAEKQIYSCLSSQPLHIDEIMQKTALSSGKLLAYLLKLEHKKLIKELPGKLFVIIDGSPLLHTAL